MKYEQMLFALMVLVATAGAVNDTITVGSCEISFYLNDVDYVVTIGKTVSNQSISGVEHNYTEATISTEGGSVYIDVDSYDAVSTIHFTNWHEEAGPGDLYPRTIDGRDTILLVGEGENVYYCTIISLDLDYWLDVEEAKYPWIDHSHRGDHYAYLNGRNFVQINSYANWNITKALFDTLHIEVIKNGS